MHFPKVENSLSPKEMLEEAIKMQFEKVGYFIKIYQDIFEKLTIKNIQLILLYTLLDSDKSF